jgi:hypothetical protein
MDLTFCGVLPATLQQSTLQEALRAVTAAGQRRMQESDSHLASYFCAALVAGKTGIGTARLLQQPGPQSTSESATPIIEAGANMPTQVANFPELLFYLFLLHLTAVSPNH